MSPQWYVLNGTATNGPYTVDALRQMLAESHVTQDTLIWKEGQQQWTPLRAFPDILGASSPPPPPQFMTHSTAAPALPVPLPIRIVGSRVYLAEGYNLTDEYCITCGCLSHKRYARKFSFVPPAIWISVIAPLLLLILWACLRKERRIRFGLCEEHAKKVLIMNTICWSSGFLFIPSWILAANMEDSGFAAFFVILGFALLVTWIVFCNLARPIKIEGFENGYIRIRGVCSSLRDSLKG
jgi:hypothetical protein